MNSSTWGDVLADAVGSMTVTQDGGVITIRLIRPDKHNAISFAMWSALGRLMPALADRDDVDVVVLAGTEGGPFSAGADISEFTTLRSDPDGAQAYSEAVAAGEGALIAFPKPTIALVQGFAIGGGTQLAVACDLRICDTTARFAITPARLGIVYALESTARLVETVGAPWARWILLTGEHLDAAAALRIGLVHEVLPSEHVVARAYDLAATLASRARVSLLGGKQLIGRSVAGTLLPDDDVRALYAASLHSREYAEGVAAFLAKRPADFPAARAQDTPSS
ncbi:MAG: enoyl-CoA hydratase-related protein [Mycobacteriales bacterium]